MKMQEHVGKSWGCRGSCPYAPTEKEISEHARQYEDFETV